MFDSLLEFSFVDTHPAVLFFNVLQLVNIVLGYQGELESATPYSKFAAGLAAKDDKTDAMVLVRSKIGMLIIYTPSVVTAVMMLLVLPNFVESIQTSAAGWMVLVHFLKRDIEVLFLHKYSGSAAYDITRFIGFFYALVTFMICFLSTPEPSQFCSQLGQVLFSIGIAGNYYHHNLLASLRTTKGSDGKKYVAPRGGLFEYVAAPHYFFELIGWLGIAIASQRLTPYLNFLSMSAYLAARSVNQNKWNNNKFGEKEWPASRKHMIPFVY